MRFVNPFRALGEAIVMATADGSGLPFLLESLEDGAAGQPEQTDAYLTIANRLSGEEGRQLLPAVEKYFPRLGRAALTHMTSGVPELSQAALQALGFCVYHSRVVSGLPETFALEILTALCNLVAKSTDKNTCTRALWVISKQNFPPEVVAKKAASVLRTLESVWSREDIQSVVMEHEALNVVIRMLEQVPDQMGDGVVRWVRVVVPLVVHSASKVRLRAAAAMELGMPVLMEKQAEVAAIIEPLMSTKLIPELQKLFMAKKESNVLKLWPLFVRLLGKLLHRGGSFINSLLHLEELGFRSSSPSIKKIAFIAWKSLIENFALNPDILCSSKRLKLLMQPLVSIHVRTEALLLTKVEVWWNLVVKLGPNLSANFDQVAVPLLQHVIGSEPSSSSSTPSRPVTQNGTVAPGTPGFGSPAGSSWLSLNSSVRSPASTFPSVQLLGLEMLLHFFLGSEVVATAAKAKLVLSLEPLKHPLLTGAPSFTKHAAALTSSLRDGFVRVGKDAPESLLATVWTSLVRVVNVTVESGSKKDRHGCDVLTLMLQALQDIIVSEDLPADKVLVLFNATVKGLPHRVLGSASYQVGKMDVLNGTPALFLLLLLYDGSMLPAYAEDESFFQCLQMLVGCGLSGPASPLAFAEAVLAAIGRGAASVRDAEQLFRMWSVVVGQLTDTITRSNEVNQGDALEHNFGAVHSALMFPVTHLLRRTPLHQATQKSMLSSWSKLYRVFARCSALVVTAEENVCCEEFCAKVTAAVGRDALKVPSTLHVVTSVLQVVVECVDFSPYSPQFQQKLKTPHTPVNWVKKRSKVLGNLSTFQTLLVRCLQVYLEDPEGSAEAPGLALVSILSALFANFALANAIKEALASLLRPVALFSKLADSENQKFSSQLLGKLEKLLVDVLGGLQTRSALAYDDELLALLSPLLCVLLLHKNKQLRAASAQFWNATFANSAGLAYPDEIRPILSQVKQKTPLVLPGFDVVGVPDELSGQYPSSESSQLETKLSGMIVSSVGKRDLLLGKAPEPKDNGSLKTSKQVSTKLDFGSPKPPRREVLEEEASIDFVFIPPETKERVLTEHQKEVKRTKRVDIPAMYNNLDASLDTTVFTQYTQSQEDTLDKPPTEQANTVSEETSAKVPLEDVRKEEGADVLAEETKDPASPGAVEDRRENPDEEVMNLESADVSVEDDTKNNDRAEDTDMKSKGGPSSNIAVSPDLTSGMSQKPNSRRQSFITLEKYNDVKTASPSIASKFTGLLIRTSNTQELPSTNNTASSPASQTFPESKPQESQSTGGIKSERSVKETPDSPLRPNDVEKKYEPVRLMERMSSDATEDEDVIPDTQTEVDKDGTAMESSEELNSSSRERDSEQNLEDSQSSVTPSSSGEPRRSGRRRIRPLMPGEDARERQVKHGKYERRHSAEQPKADSPSSGQSGPKTRSTGKQAAGEDGGGLRTRARRDRESNQTNSRGRVHKRIKLHSSSEDFLDNQAPGRRSTRESSQPDLQSDSQSDYESRPKGKVGRPRKLPLKEGSEIKKKGSAEKEESSQTAARGPELVEQSDEDNKPTEDSQMVSSPHTSRCQEKTHREKDSQADTSSPHESQDGSGPMGKLAKESKVDDETSEGASDSPSPENSQAIAASTDGQATRRSRRSRTTPEAAESEGKGESKDSPRRPGGSGSQPALPAVSQGETSVGGRTRRSRVKETQPGGPSTPEHSQPLGNAGTPTSSQGRSKCKRPTSHRSLASNEEPSESESLEPGESTPVRKKRGGKSPASPQSPRAPESNRDRTNGSVLEADAEGEAADLDGSRRSGTAPADSPRRTGTTEEPRDTSPAGAEGEEKMDTEVTNESASLVASPREEERDLSAGHASSRDCGAGDLHAADALDSVGSVSEEAEPLPDDASVVRGHSTSAETMPVSETSGSDASPTVPSDEIATAKQNDDSSRQEDPVVPAGDGVEENQEGSFGRGRAESPDGTKEDLSREEEERFVVKGGRPHAEAADGEAVEQEGHDEPQTVERRGEESRTADAEKDCANLDAALPGLASADAARGSPLRETDPEALAGSDVGQSPSGGGTKGAWSPLASPSTSILKKAQKRPPEEEASSPLLKSRRVSFADPIQRQETADDIDRRSPALRTSSPRRSQISSIPQAKYVTTPTKGLLVLSPRNRHSPGYKSSKKCLMSEMSRASRPVSRDCIYPALVGCSTPVEAVLPHISSNMWSRGFGQLVRARNVKTVGDLSALTPNEVKALPIRSPKVSNVKKALRTFELRKGRGGDELKSFDETELMTSELEETAGVQNQDEDKASLKMLATELEDELAPADGKPEGGSGDQTAGSLPGEPGSRGQPEGLASGVEALSCRLTPLELSRCSPQQLVQIHDRLGGMMRGVVVEMRNRLCRADDKP
ncbi:telomere-associated protein RIF1 [Brachionichthys hirsutus]|uniref:telomere-associated protein RIF1 n=1 Tax=Brachionichthys hirsutus TaxID=412623 RepID=UPI003604BA4E